MTITQVTVVQGVALQPGPQGNTGPQGPPGAIATLDVLRGWTTLQYFVPTNIAYAVSGTTVWDTQANPSARLAMIGGNSAMGTPLNVIEGAYYALRTVQDTPPRALTWQPGAFLWPGGAGNAVAPTNVAGAIDIFHFRGAPGGNALEFVGAQMNIKA